MNNDTGIIIPVYNEAEVVSETVNGVLKVFSNVVCVNDGSSDESSEKITHTKAILVEHPINLGQGAALQTGIEFLLQNKDIHYFVTFDADGQHNIKDVQRMIKVIKKQNIDIVLGSRFLGVAEDMPALKIVILKMAIIFTNIFSGVKLTDTHNGLRVFNRKFAENLNITMSDMAHASEIIDKLGKGNWAYEEVPITIKYTDYSRAKGQSLFNSINILFDLMLKKVSKK